MDMMIEERATIEGPELVKMVGKLKALCEKDGVVEFVFGLPLDVEGAEGVSSKRIRNFAAKLGLYFPDNKISFVDESYSTFEAKGLQRKFAAHGADDEFAAIIILQRYLAKF